MTRAEREVSSAPVLAPVECRSATSRCGKLCCIARSRGPLRTPSLTRHSPLRRRDPCCGQVRTGAAPAMVPACRRMPRPRPRKTAAALDDPGHADSSEARWCRGSAIRPRAGTRPERLSARLRRDRAPGPCSWPLGRGVPALGRTNPAPAGHGPRVPGQSTPAAHPGRRRPRLDIRLLAAGSAARPCRDVPAGGAPDASGPR